jgi:hypothetical protein
VLAQLRPQPTLQHRLDQLGQEPARPGQAQPVALQCLVPNGGEAELAGCAVSAYDQQWRDFGRLMVRNGRGDSEVNLGWEMNEARRVLPARGDRDPAVLLDWSINGHGTPARICCGRSTNCYPGDAYLDIIGIDNYDHFRWTSSKAVSTT